MEHLCGVSSRYAIPLLACGLLSSSLQMRHDAGDARSTTMTLKKLEPSATAFFCYVRSVDRHDGEFLSDLRKLLSDEVRVQSGREFCIFQDRKDISWGENWQSRIVESLNTAALLIPVLTPGFFESKHCRNEVEVFLRREERLKRNDLILPIYYIDCPHFNDPHQLRADGLARELSHRQFADWRELRFEDISSKNVRREVALIAEQVVRILKQTTQPQQTDENDHDEDVTEIMQRPLGTPYGRRQRGSIDIFEHFCTAHEAAREDQFVGRQRELRTGVNALRSQGASIVIYGFAGVGKTSIAMQIASIAAGGQRDLLSRHGLLRLVPENGFHMPVAYYACDFAVDQDIASTLLSVLLTSSGKLRLSRLLEDIQTRRSSDEADVKSALRSLEQIRALGRCDEARRSAVHTFRNIAGVISRANGDQPLVMVIDEFNVIQDKSGFASLIKTEPILKFVLVGTAPDIRLLVTEHDSVQRQIAEGQIRVHPMVASEVEELLTLEEKRSCGAFKFDAESRQMIFSASRGYPFFVHFFGRYSLDQAIMRAERNGEDHAQIWIRKHDVIDALHERLVDLADVHAKYMDTVSGRWEREVVMKLFSFRDEDDVPLANIERHAVTLGVQNVGTHLAWLYRNQVLLRTAEKHYKFADERLRIFTRLVQPSCEETRKRIAFFFDVKKRRATEEGWLFPGEEPN